jgi:4-amino-4-deoxy-L-arabinose transferase-like glycosyltransferase
MGGSPRSTCVDSGSLRGKRRWSNPPGILGTPAGYGPLVMGRRRSPVAWSLVLPVAAVELLLLVATANRYGYHRDELYFRVAARHPAWGYDDQPALTPLVGRLSEWMFGDDPRGLRALSAVAITLVVVIVALIARELGAGRSGQAVAALATAASGAAMAVGHLLSTTTFDVLTWVTLLFLVARILGGGDARLWLLVGLVVGLGLENKHTVLLLVTALACGCLLDRRWRLAQSRWLWAGAALAFALWLPNLIWQAQHGWPQLELADKISQEDPLGNRVELLPLQLLLIGPLLAPLWVGGLWWLLRRAEARPYRPLGLAYLVLLAVVLVTGAKPYYTMGLLLALLGAGGVVAETWLRGGRGRRLTLGVALAVSAVVAAAITLPLVPVQDVHATPIAEINEDAIETIGWPSFTATVARVWNRLPPSERYRAVVYASNYGEAGAIARFGPKLGIPRAYSGHNAFWRFGRPPDGARPIIAVGYHNPASLRGIFDRCALSARIDNGVTLDNEEQGAPVWTCSTTAEPWSRLWPRLRSLNP